MVSSWSKKRTTYKTREKEAVTQLRATRHGGDFFFKSVSLLKDATKNTLHKS